MFKIPICIDHTTSAEICVQLFCSLKDYRIHLQTLKEHEKKKKASSWIRTFCLRNEINKKRFKYSSLRLRRKPNQTSSLLSTIEEWKIKRGWVLSWHLVDRKGAEQKRTSLKPSVGSLCCVVFLLTNQPLRKKHGRNSKQWCNYSNVWKAWANYFSVNALRASSHPDLKLLCQCGDAAAPRRGMQSSVKNNLPGATRVICVFICDLLWKSTNSLTKRNSQQDSQ